MSNKEDLTKAEQYENFMVPTAHRVYQTVPGVRGIGIKPMNVLDSPSVWSATFRMEAGVTLPARENTALVELLVVSGKGTFDSGVTIEQGDYLREEAGEYEKLTADSELEFFLTNHGQSQFLDDDGRTLWNATPAEIVRLKNVEETMRNHADN